MIDRTERDERTQAKKQRETVDDDAHTDQSVDPSEHYGQASELPTDEELRDDAETAG